MNTNTTKQTGSGAPEPSEQLSTKTWNVLLDGEVIGSVHGQTREQAQDTIAPFRMKNLTVAPRN